MKQTGQQLRSRREELGLSQAKLSELTGISQHVLSAYELEKTELSQETIQVINQALGDDSQVKHLAKRAKRYRTHEYTDVPVLTERIAKAKMTPGNVVYRELLASLENQHGSINHDISALSLFSGCGGFSYGFSAAGYKIKGFLEIDPELRLIYAQNFPNSRELGSDITLVKDEVIKQFAKELGEIDVIIGGPPCQGFSLSGKRDIKDPRNTLFLHYLRFVRIFQPKVAVMENVRLLTSMKTASGRLVTEEICEEFERLAYSVAFFEINAKDYGVPEHRERVLFVAIRKDLKLPPSIPPATHGEESTLFHQVQPIRSFADACSDLAYLESGGTSSDPLHQAVKHPQHVIDWLWDVQEGKSAHENADPSKRPPSGYNTTYKRQVWFEPASTVQTTFGMISGCRNVHPIATRSLTVREAARIQSFPDSYKFVGTIGAIRTGIGNAVPPLLAYEVGQYLRSTFLNFIKVSSLNST